MQLLAGECKLPVTQRWVASRFNAHTKDDGNNLILYNSYSGAIGSEGSRIQEAFKCKHRVQLLEHRGGRREG